MDLSSTTKTKSKRGRPKGSKNKVKLNPGDNNASRTADSFINKSDDKSLDVVSQMESFRNSILEKLKHELFGGENNTTLPTPPMNLSTLFSSMTNMNQTYETPTSANDKNVQDKKILHRSKRDSKKSKVDKSVSADSSMGINVNLHKSGRPRLAENLKINSLSENEFMNNQKNKELSLQKFTNCNSSNLSHVNEFSIAEVFPSGRVSPSSSKVPASVALSQQSPLHISLTKNYLQQSDSVELNPHEENFFLEGIGDTFSEKKISGSQNENLATSSVDISVKTKKKKLKPKNSISSVCLESIYPKLEAAEKLLQDMSLSPRNNYSSKNKLQEADDDCLILARIFSKSVAKPVKKPHVLSSKPSFSNKLLASYSSFCRWKMNKEMKCQMNQQSISVHKNIFGATSLEKSHSSENKSIKDAHGSSSNNEDVVNFGSVPKTTVRSHNKPAGIKGSPARPSVGIQCEGIEKIPSLSSSLLSSSNKKSNSFSDSTTQTDEPSHKQLFDICIQTDVSEQQSSPILCFKCKEPYRATEKCPGRSQPTTPCKTSIPLNVSSIFATSLLNNLNFTISKFGDMFNEPPALINAVNVEELTLNLQNKFMDTTFFNELLSTTMTDMQEKLKQNVPGLELEVGLANELNSLSASQYFDDNLQALTSEAQTKDGKVPNCFKTPSLMGDCNEVIVLDASISAAEKQKEVDQVNHEASKKLLSDLSQTCDDMIIGGNLPGAKQVDTVIVGSSEKDGNLINSQSFENVTLLDEAFINVSESTLMDDNSHVPADNIFLQNSSPPVTANVRKVFSSSNFSPSPSEKRKKRKRLNDEVELSDLRTKRRRREDFEDAHRNKDTVNLMAQPVSELIQNFQKVSTSCDKQNNTSTASSSITRTFSNGAPQTMADVPVQDRNSSHKKTKIKSPVYKKIKRCTYVDAKPVCRDYEPHTCSCKVIRPNDAGEVCCGDSCLNRLVYTECRPSTCPTGEKCSNRRIQKRHWVEGLIKFQTKDRGYGVKTLQPLTTGQFIIEYCGEVVSENEFRRRMSQEYKDEKHHYCLNLDGGMVIDGYKMGNVSRFINHSCQPNCIMEKWNVNGIYRMGLFAIGNIPVGTELTYDYNFHAYNLLSQQICKCGSPDCRGVMGGKNQRINKEIKPNKSVVKKQISKRIRPGYMKNPPSVRNNDTIPPVVPVSLPVSSLHPPPVAPLSNKFYSNKEKLFVRKQKLFLIRNVKRRNVKDVQLKNSFGGNQKNSVLDKKVDKRNQPRKYGKFIKSLPGFEKMFNFKLKQSRDADRRSVVLNEDADRRSVVLNEVTDRRSVVLNEDADRRSVVLNEDSDRRSVVLNEVTDTENSLRSAFTTIINTVSDADTTSLCSGHPSVQLLHLPRVPSFTQTVQQPSNIMAILNNVQLNHYKTFQDFNRDFNQLFTIVQNQSLFNSDVEDAVLNARRIYKEASRDVLSLFEDVILKSFPSDVVISTSKESQMTVVKTPEKTNNYEIVSNESISESKKLSEEDSSEVEVIRCVCNIYKDEGLMIQCEKCEKWQHCMCMNVQGDEDHYLCEICDPRSISREVLLNPQPEDALAHCRYYMTLMRDSQMQVRVGDCVYVTREGSNVDIESFRGASNLNEIKEQLDIFRVERLWKKYNGDGCAFGHYYMRPHETFHEPNRKFYPSEVFRAPLYHVVPLDAIMGTCCVLDPVTYCKGHPIDVKADDVYICEYRVDKTARLFYKITRTKHVVNTHPYCFHRYVEKLKPKRTQMMHQTEYLMSNSPG